MYRTSSHICSVLLSCLPIVSCDSSTNTRRVGIALEPPTINRQLMALDDSALRIDMVFNSGPVQTFYMHPNQFTLDVAVNGVRPNETNTVTITWYEILNGFDVEISEQSQTFFTDDNNTTIVAPHLTDQFDYDGDGMSNNQERNGGTCVWSATESCLEFGGSDVPNTQNTDSEIPAPTPVTSEGDNLLDNGNFSNGISSYGSYNTVLRDNDGHVCTDLASGPGRLEFSIIQYTAPLDLGTGNYVFEFDARSSHIGKPLNVSLYQNSTVVDLHYDFVESTTLEWERKQSVYVADISSSDLTLLIRAIVDDSETVTYCFDNMNFYLQQLDSIGVIDHTEDSHND